MDGQAFDLLKVAAEEKAAAEARESAAEDALATYALAAIVEGADLREIAAACGHEPPELPEQPAGEGWVLVSLTPQGLVVGEGTDDCKWAHEFANWICRALSKRIIEGLGVHDGS